jgi:hypothetical protein
MMIYQQANVNNPTGINEEVNLDTIDGNEDSGAADGPGDDAVVNAETGDESLTTVRV